MLLSEHNFFPSVHMFVYLPRVKLVQDIQLKTKIHIITAKNEKKTLIKFIYNSYLEKSRHPCNWLPSLREQKWCKAAKKRLKNCQNQPKIKWKILLSGKCIFLLPSFLNFFQVWYKYTIMEPKADGAWHPSSISFSSSTKRSVSNESLTKLLRYRVARNINYMWDSS